MTERNDLFPLESTNLSVTDDLTNQKINQLGIGHLNDGFDSLQIRIWYDYSLLKKRDLLILRLEKEKWSGTHHSMIVDWDAYKQTETVKENTITRVTPKSGWNNFLNKLSDLKITSLPNMADIPNLVDNWDDGNYYNIEIAKGKKYRFYTYHVPDEFQDKFWQAHNVTEILHLISLEFDVPN